MNVATFFAAVLPFAIAMSFTPGPNNLMLASAGARFGFARTLPHQLGILIGVAVMMLCVGFGIAALIAAAPPLYAAMKIASILYMLYLAWRIATAESVADVSGKAGPMGFWAAAGFQWINPKAWIMTLTAVATYTTLKSDPRPQIVMLALVFALVGAASSSAWVLFGQLIRRYLTSPRRRIAFNRTMAVLLIASIVPVIFER
ncbi:LysE family translocator [Sphingomonas bacterium]|uniref:LysE family translocator n=1 Tax=Sphingomonas bacterium TaxID=1895847 RepID=UPI001575CFEC|nr:LysE family translocator [Sphingomonas bacterium]